MKKAYFLLCLLFLCLIGSISSCTNDSADEQPDQESENPQGEDQPSDDDFTPVGVVELLNPSLVDDSYILVNDAAANRVFVMDKQARLLHEWALTNNIGNDVFLLPNGKLLASLESDSPKVTFGGKGGRLQFVGEMDTVEWDFIFSTDEAETHHDAELLPNGNIVALVWEKRTIEEAMDSGFMEETIVYPEAIIEVNPETNEIVWEWHAWDHLVQDFDPAKSNYGVVSEHPELIDINYTRKTGEWPEVEQDIMHANALSYDPVKDVLFVSVNFYSEVWVIDHSTSTDEAASHSGGNYAKGGDLIYRFGNPETYENSAGTRLFHNQHYPNPLKGSDQGKMLIFSNGNDLGQSTVYELQLPSEYNLIPESDNEPDIIWSFTDPDLYSQKVSGAVPLANGNILITEGDFGFWEVTRDKEVVWKFSSEGFFWRGYSYEKEAAEIQIVLSQ